MAAIDQVRIGSAPPAPPAIFVESVAPAPVLDVTVTTDRTVVVASRVEPPAAYLPPIDVVYLKGDKGEPGTQGAKGDAGSDPTYIAGAVVSGGIALEFAPDGTVVPANPPLLMKGWSYAGISLAAAQPGQPVDIRMVGEVTAPWWDWQHGLPVFVGQNGSLTQHPPDAGYSQTVGFAIGSTSIRLSDDSLIFVGA